MVACRVEPKLAIAFLLESVWYMERTVGYDLV